MPETAFLGAGKMASAIVRGLIAARILTPAEMVCIGGGGTSARCLAADTGIRQAKNVDDLLARADVLVLACKPQQFAFLDPRLCELAAGRLVLSVLAGFTTERIGAFFKKARGIVAVMPNTPAQVRAGVTAWAAPAGLPAEDARLVERYFGALGRVRRMDATLMNTVSAASGSGPGFFFEFVHAFERSVEKAGLSPDDARLFVRETFIGAARLLEQTGSSPEALRDAVTSPNGSTFAGLRVFERQGLHGIFEEVVRAAVARAGELGKM